MSVDSVFGRPHRRLCGTVSPCRGKRRARMPAPSTTPPFQLLWLIAMVKAVRVVRIKTALLVGANVGKVGERRF